MVPYSKFKSGLWLPRHRPTGPVEINWNHGLASGLVGYWLLGNGGAPVDLVTGVRATLQTGPVTPKVGPQGLEDDFGSIAGSGWNVGSGHLLTSLANFSVVVGFRQTAVNDAMLYTERAATGNDLFKMGIQGGPPSVLFTQFRNDGGTLIQSSGTVTLTAAFTVAGLSYNTTNFRHFVDGTFDFQAAWGSNNTFTNASTVRAIGYDAGDGGQSGENIVFVALWKRTLSDQEQTVIGLNPFDILQPRTSVSFFTQPSTTGTISASTKKPAASVTGTETFSSTISASTKKPAASVTAAEAFAASIAASTKKPAASVTGASAFIGTIAASTKKPASSVTTVEIFAATISTSTRKPTSAITALAGNLGSITSTTKKPTVSVSAVEQFSATFAVSTKKPTVSVTALSGYIGSFNSTTRKPAASVSGTETFTATVASTTKKPTANLSSVFINTATIAGTTRKPSASVSTAEIYAATIAASTRKPAANFASAGVYTGGIVSATRKPTAAIAVAEIFTAAIAAATRKPHASIAVTNTNADTTATISASTRRPRVQIFVSNPVPKSRPIIIWMT